MTDQIEVEWQEKLMRFREAMARLINASSEAISARRSEQNARSLVFSIRAQLVNFAAEHDLELPPDLAVFRNIRSEDE